MLEKRYDILAVLWQRQPIGLRSELLDEQGLVVIPDFLFSALWVMVHLSGKSSLIQALFR